MSTPKRLLTDDAPDADVKRPALAKFIIVSTVFEVSSAICMLWIERCDDWFPELFDEARSLLNVDCSYVYGEDFNIPTFKRLHFLLSVLAYGVEIPSDKREPGDAFDVENRAARHALLAVATADDHLDIPYKRKVDQPSSVVGDVAACTIYYM